MTELKSGSTVFQMEDGDGGATELFVKGQITEETDFEPVLPHLGDNLVIDLSAVDRINSCGVREWVGFVRGLDAGAKRFVLQKCSPVIVAQLNSIANFAGQGTVTSVLGPYYCGECDDEHDIFIDLTSGEEHDWDTPVSCPKCQSEMEFDDIEEMYLGFRSQM